MSRFPYDTRYCVHKRPPWRSQGWYHGKIASRPFFGTGGFYVFLEVQETVDYSKTLNLPETQFPMRGNLPQREPEIIDFWQKNDIDKKRVARRAGKEKFILHDGPPYANGNIHIGHTINKVLKDIIIKYKTLRGFQAPYVPGWDTHGLPIEHAAIKNLGLNRHELDPLQLRQECNAYAHKWIDAQRSDFKRLGVCGDWDNPYVTLKPSYEAKQIEVFGEMAKKGHIYKGLKTVYWCVSCETALAEAEIEYAEKKSHSIFVKFPLVDAKGKLPAGVDASKTYAVIWTTTTWTLPANAGIALHPEIEYAWVKVDEEVYLLAAELAEQVVQAAKKENFTILERFKGSDVEGLVFHHPFLERQAPIVLGEHVTLEQGTGCVHTAPGHGPEDFEVGKKYGLPVINPVNPSGVFTEEAGPFAGMQIEDANVPIIKELASRGLLLAKGSIRHQYAHCWRCKNPVIYRATEQWFSSVAGYREEALAAIRDVKWYPGWGEERIHNMVADRQDWCISRQRVWGVPIPIFYCRECNEPLINDDTIQAVAALFGREGSDAWWKYDAEDILPSGTTCPKCGHDHFRKESDIMDVWFDSGSSHAAVLEQREELAWPADMYLEGSDQHRGWFQSSLLTSVATRGRAPYKAVLTHGFVVDGEGRKMSKSVGNVIFPEQVIKQYGADILRLWVVSADYQGDVRISNDILKQLAEIYRKIRNTFRYMLSNLNDFDANQHAVAYEQLSELDRWALLRLEQVREKVTAAYDRYEFHTLYHTIHNFCTIDLSAVYLDIIKDRLYAELPDDQRRWAAQTVMHKITMTLLSLLAPVLTFTSEEIWRYLPQQSGQEHLESIQLSEWPEACPQYLDEALDAKWTKLLAVRGDIMKALEQARRNKDIGHSLDANLVVYTAEENLALLSGLTAGELASLTITSGAEVLPLAEAPDNAVRNETGDMAVLVQAAKGEKCERCWIYSQSVGQNEEHPTLCARCATVLSK